MRLVKTSPNARRGDEAIAVSIDRSRNNAVGVVLAKPEGLRQLFGKFQLFYSLHSFSYARHKKIKISSKILAAHVRYMCEHTLGIKMSFLLAFWIASFLAMTAVARLSKCRQTLNSFLSVL